MRGVYCAGDNSISFLTVFLRIFIIFALSAATISSGGTITFVVTINHSLDHHRSLAQYRLRSSCLSSVVLDKINPLNAMCQLRVFLLRNRDHIDTMAARLHSSWTIGNIDPIRRNKSLINPVVFILNEFIH